MDCVGCEKCRLWGKLQVLGLGTALEILFSVDGQPNTRQNVSISFKLFHTYTALTLRNIHCAYEPPREFDL